MMMCPAVRHPHPHIKSSNFWGPQTPVINERLERFLFEKLKVSSSVLPYFMCAPSQGDTFSRWHLVVD